MPAQENTNVKLFKSTFNQYLDPTYIPDLSTGIIYLPIRVRLNKKLVDLPIK